MQKGRGTEGFGFVVLHEGRILHEARSEGEEEIMTELNKVCGDEIVFHHRYPTSTPNVREAAHPITVSNKTLKHDYRLIHNGIIWGDDDKKIIHEKEGFVYTTEIKQALITRKRKLIQSANSKWNDSECLAIELAKDIDAEGSGIDLNGSIAFVMLQVSKKTRKTVKMFWGTNGRMPLKCGEVEGVYRIISSEGFGRDVPPHKLFEFDYETKTLSCRDYQIGSASARAGYTYEPEPVTPVSVEDSESYYDLLERYDRLQKQYNLAVSTGEDETQVQESLDEVEWQLSQMERDFDTKNLNRHLIG